jgi:hypothetical protein
VASFVVYSPALPENETFLRDLGVRDVLTRDGACAANERGTPSPT